MQNPMTCKFSTASLSKLFLTLLLLCLVEFIAQKPNYVDPSRPSDLRKFNRPATSSDLDYDSTRVDRIFKQKSMQKRIETGKAIPRQRCKWQQTAAQEIGWDVAPLIPVNPKYNASRKSCQITQYADNYRLTKKKNPFSRDVFLYRDMPHVDPNAAA